MKQRGGSEIEYPQRLRVFRAASGLDFYMIIMRIKMGERDAEREGIRTRKRMASYLNKDLLSSLALMGHGEYEESATTNTLQQKAASRTPSVGGNDLKARVIVLRLCFSQLLSRLG
jgi:hypothetical protein